ncbi:transmembrane protein 64 [Episyrphus balteatus]|uniref:transmembrane protein 64 n=1 Tax=Episyrphus balteatus TaxID=286459 RepID=UPI0024869436|nr:transmembrane protein 64 [Episyrphus balteatus]
MSSTSEKAQVEVTTTTTTNPTTPPQSAETSAAAAVAASTSLAQAVDKMMILDMNARLQEEPSSSVKSKAPVTLIVHENNGKINTSLTTDSDSGCERDEHDTLTNSKSRRPTNSVCLRVHGFISDHWYLSYLVPLAIVCALVIVAYLMRDYARELLYWVETQNPWVVFGIFMCLFVLVSFPIVVGYFVLMISSGYLFGFIKGLLTVILGANIGITIAHLTLRSLRHRLPVHKLIKNETGRAILRVISGPRAFRVVLFTRLTPIPFGLQNAIFGISTVNSRVYHTATFLGLLPAQTINVYLGSTLRSMHEVLNNHGTAVTGYISFGIEVIFGVGLMIWVVQKARKELATTLLSEYSGSESKLNDIQV